MGMNVKQKVVETIQQLAEEQGKPITKVNDDDCLVDNLGFTSLEVATLVSLLETTFEVDPFSSGIAAITDIRNVEDLCSAYEKALAKG